MRTAPFDPVLGYFLGDYEGLAHANNSFLPFFVKSNSGTKNPTDVFIGLSGEDRDTATNGHIEVNANPVSMVARMKARRVNRQFRQ
jgi:hypothetical protein